MVTSLYFGKATQDNPTLVGAVPSARAGCAVIDAFSGPHSKREPFSWVQTLTENADGDYN